MDRTTAAEFTSPRDDPRFAAFTVPTHASVAGAEGDEATIVETALALDLADGTSRVERITWKGRWRRAYLEVTERSGRRVSASIGVCGLVRIERRRDRHPDVVIVAGRCLAIDVQAMEAIVREEARTLLAERIETAERLMRGVNETGLGRRDDQR